jgi:hypothetical protein
MRGRIHCIAFSSVVLEKVSERHHLREDSVDSVCERFTLHETPLSGCEPVDVRISTGTIRVHLLPRKVE